MLVLGGFSTQTASAERFARAEEFKTPDIKDEFCGQRIDYQICKCAFHGELCQNIGRDKKTANFILYSRYDAYVSDLRERFAASCRKNGGKFAKDRCEYYENTDKEKACLPADFSRDWKKYSDLDDAISPEERSFEARSHYETLQKIVKNSEEIFLLTRDLEIDRLMRLELKDYKQSLVKNIKANLLRSFWRLAWITYDNIQSGRASGGTFEKMYDLESISEGMAAFLKTIRSVTPGDSKIAINTENISGKVKSVGLSAALDALESVGDPVTVATTLVSETVKQTFPSADITPEEVEVLRNQHLKNNILDDIIQESYRKNRERRLKAESLKAENETLAIKLSELEDKEKTRVQNEIIEKCEK